MKILEMLPQLDADALATVRLNALRLAEHGNPKQKKQATEALPLIEAEQTRRADAAPPKVTKTRAKAKAKPTATSAKAAEAIADAPSVDAAGMETAQPNETGKLH